VGHFYLKDGTPFYEVPYAGKRQGTRSATITDAKKVNAYPSVTTIIDSAAKPALTNWIVEQNILSALTNPKITKDMPIKEIMSLIKADAREQSIAAADEGTAIHDAIEAYFKEDYVPMKYQATVKAVVDLLEEKCGEQDWEAERWFACNDGYGGKIDLISPHWVIDFKTKDGDLSDVKGWDEHLMQLCAYDKGTSYDAVHPWRRKANVMVSRTEPGRVAWVEWNDFEEHDRAWNMFTSLLNYWHEQKRYFPHK